MNLSQRGLEIIKAHEGLRRHTSKKAMDYVATIAT